MSNVTVNCLLNQEIYDALEVESEDIAIVWVLTEDGLWQLCVQCEECDSWLQYPWVDHACVDSITWREQTEEAKVCMVIQTSMDELTEDVEYNEIEVTI